MHRVRYLLLGLLVVGLVVTGTGWYRAAEPGADRAFTSCRFEGDTLVLSYGYGVGDTVSPSVDTSGTDIVVALRVERGPGSVPAVGLLGEARFAIYDGHRTVRYPGGEVLTCPG